MKNNFIRVSALMLSIIMIFSLCSCSLTSYDDDTETQKYASAVPTTKAEILDRFNEIIATAKKSTPAVSYSLSQGAKGAVCKNNDIKSAFKTVANYITDEDFAVSNEYGTKPVESFPVMGSNDPSVLKITDISTALITDNQPEKTYNIYITINPETNPTQDSSVYGKIYKISADKDVLAYFDCVKNLISVSSYDATYGTGSIKATVDKASGHITKLELSREVQVMTSLTGEGTLEALGTSDLSFTYTSTEKFDINWDNPDTEEVEV